MEAKKCGNEAPATTRFRFHIPYVHTYLPHHTYLHLEGSWQQRPIFRFSTPAPPRPPLPGEERQTGQKIARGRWGTKRTRFLFNSYILLVHTHGPPFAIFIVAVTQDNNPKGQKEAIGAAARCCT